MTEAGIGRVLVASLHQGIADILPSRLEFYENWLNPDGLRHGTIGLAPLAAVLSFLRLEGEAYELVTTRAGQYAADWTVADLHALQRQFARRLPAQLRTRFALQLARRLVHRSYISSRAFVKLRKGNATVDLRASIFCGVREPAEHPLCGFYAAAVERFLRHFNTVGAVRVTECRGMGSSHCVLSVRMSANGQPADQGELP